MSHQQRRSGFTLAELLIVIAIIAILVAIAVPVFSHYLAQAEATTCAYNQAAMKRQIIFEELTNGQSDDPPTSELIEFMGKLSKDIYCPTGNEFKINQGQPWFLFSVTCKNPAHKGEIIRTVPNALMDEFLKVIAENNGKWESANNDRMRKQLLERNGGTWPTLEVDGRTYNIQPFFDEKTKTFTVFANSSVQGDWNASYVYNSDKRKWYTAPEGKKSIIMLVGKNAETINKELESKKWVEASDCLEGNLIIK